MNEAPAQRSPPSGGSVRGIDWDAWTSVVFTLLGLAVCVHAWGFPAGARGVPGPGFFPIVVGLLLIALSVTLWLTTRHAPRHPYWTRADGERVLPRIVAILLLLVVYVSFWTVVPFVVRTPILLIVIYRLLGESWGRALLLAAVLTAGLHILFQGFLSVQL